jgi:1-acyl-sn-glycerol-3-phosphate acyltransferase
MRCVYRVAQLAIGFALPLQMRLHVTGRERVPATGPTLLISNHLSLVDPLVIGASLPRELHILAKAELFEWPVIGGLARMCGVVPIWRGHWDVAALVTLEEILRAGHGVLIFPEGTYAMPPHPAALLPFQIGAAWLEARVHVPVVPVGIWGSEQVWMPRRGWRPWHRPQVYVHVGVPYLPHLPANHSSRDALQSVADEMASHICALIPERYHGHYQGHYHA